MRIRTTAAFTSTTLVLGLALAVAPQAAAAPAGQGLRQTGPATTVTLLTGDKVRVSADARGGTRTAILPDKRRAGIVFQTYTRGEHNYVFPSDAMPLVLSGRLDRDLFDVAGLAKAGYDDRRADLPLIQTGPSTRAAGVRSVRELPVAGARALSADKAALPDSWRALTAAGGKVWLDRKVEASLDRSTAQIGAPAAWQAGLTGAGVTVGVVDTGIDQTHPDLAGREVGERNFTDDPSAEDVVGHGTHVASIVAGGGAKYRGVANGAKVLDAKALSRDGGQLSWIIAGVEWAVDSGAKVVNLSLGASDTPEVDPLEETVNRLTAERGTLFVVSAGNSGPSSQSVGTPGSADAALTVGSVERDDTVSFFSSRGPRVGDGAIKPDVTAPGSGIVAAKAANGVIGDPVEPGYVGLSGTSMAAPHVAGAAALLAQQHPEWTGAQLKAVLTASAKPTAGESVFAQGSGRVDVAKALTQALTTQPTSVSLGTLQWPHNDDTAVTKDLTYRNTSSAPVALDLAVTGTGPDGKPAPAGFFSVTPAKLTVPAGGTATAKVTGDSRLGTLDGGYSGAVTATGGGQSLSTPVALDREVESYDVRLRYLGPDGKPSTDWRTLAIGLYSDYFGGATPDASGVATVRLPKGAYVLDSVYATTGEKPDVRSLPYPAFEVKGATEVVVDARKTKPVRVTPPDPRVPLWVASSGYELSPIGGRRFGLGIAGPLFDGFGIGQIGPELPANVLIWALAAVYYDDVTNTGDFYNFAWYQEKSVPTGFTRVVRRGDVATLRTKVGPGLPGSNAGRALYPYSLDGRGITVSTGRAFEGGEVVEYVNAGGVQWQGDVFIGRPDQESVDTVFTSEPVRTKAGQTYRTRTNHGVFGPALPRSVIPWAERWNNTFGINIGLWGDSGGNAGFSNTTSAKTTLFRNGKKIGESPTPGGGIFPVPEAAADYRLETEATRDPAFGVSTKIAAAWTFRSDPRQQAIPLSTVRFNAPLRDDNSAPAGKFTIPVSLQLENGTHITPRNLSVNVSYDEGKTWRKAHLRGTDLLLDHPRNATSVSLQAQATDGRGGTTTQTIIRAYLISKR
ncbi:S8 family peptidase [Actinokineospora globicatena]|uniref:S8 family peptidase n=1 Tax=Actinokineospora globicatena TaxID=103729 RepID=UPI0020A34971|nr:S8 family serine peptidase [Actinokineospora globicatena]MCP2302685.1 Subtilase family protein [Actinokineospora globicatena]GLW75627.1 serine protease [Actinokineospora globicatena]GLW82467.1 serine protease [Actinokineospora globicatena]